MKARPAMTFRSLFAAILVFASLPMANRCLAADPSTAVDWQRDVLPLLAARCQKCHGSEAQESGLRLDTRAALLEGGYSGPAVTPGKIAESRLLDAVLGRNDIPRMPPEDEPPLNAAEIAILTAWVDQGANGPAEEAGSADHRRSDHWSFRPIQRPAVPVVRDQAWLRNPVDAFVLSQLEATGLVPSPEADRATLIRRLSLDLLGLPPSVAEVDAFLADDQPAAYERLVERLLQSPHYGERWARHWLDLARYADSNGYTIDSGRSIWKYRDWVIAALNRDLPFDQFAIEQMAGDMLPEATVDQKIATGFHRNTLKNEEGGTDPEQFRVESVVDRVSTTGSVFLGLTLGCARCHDHKYDPISQREFYEFFALLNNADEPSLAVPTNQQTKEEPALLADIAQVEKRLMDSDSNSGTRQAEWEKNLPGLELSALPETVRAALAVPRSERTPEQEQLVTDEFRKVDKERKPLVTSLQELLTRKEQLAAAITTSLVMAEAPIARETHIHIRGDFLRPGALVKAAVPGILPPLVATGDTPNRLDLARWLVAPQNPLSPRVLVNRIWQQYFGQGLVATENDFGTQGALPTHPELLDWLASEVLARNWSLKEFHKLIVTSATYRQASHWRDDLVDADPYNRLLARQSRLRLEAEAVRDAALTASGLLCREVGGPGVYPPQPEGIYRFTQQVKYWTVSQGADRFRRGMYTYFWRSSPYPFLSTFDAPDANTACTRRARSNTPLQALTLANDPQFMEASQGLAMRVLAEGPADDAGRIALAMRLCLARNPSPEEADRLAQFLAGQRAAFEADPAQAEALAPTAQTAGRPATEVAAWTALSRVLINLDEFITRE